MSRTSQLRFLQQPHLRLDQKLMTSLQVLQMNVCELSIYLEEKLLLNPLIPLEWMKPREILAEDYGIPIDLLAVDTALISSSPSLAQLQRCGAEEVDLFLFLDKTTWKVTAPQPYEKMIETALHREKTRGESFFWKELQTLRYILSSRKKTLIEVGQEIAYAWHSFLLEEETKKLPLDIGTTAQRIGCHRTTLSRAIKGKMLYTPKGIIPLESCFEGVRSRKKRMLAEAASTKPANINKTA